MMGTDKRGWGVRAFGVACLVGACATAISLDAFSQGRKKPAAKAAPDAGVSSSALAASASVDDSLSDLFSPDGGLAMLLSEDAGMATQRKVAPPPLPPTPEQITGLNELKIEADAYEQSAKDYRATITRIVRQHYDERRKRILTGLDRELGTEKKALAEARAEAIRRLEVFVARYSGSNAQPEATPDAMYRLAALYDERARDLPPSETVASLRPAINLYKQIINQFPAYRETAGVYYYLGHALNDSNRLEEAQQVFRSIVCHNHYPYPVAPDPKNPDRDKVGSLPQDHDNDYWTGWHHRFPTPESLQAATQEPKKGPPGAKPKKEPEQPVVSLETAYINPFPDTCTPLPQKVDPGKDPRYLAEVWWKIGDWFFDETDPKAGPFSFNRAVTAYRRSMQASLVERGVLHGVSMYKLAWTYFKQQRYEAAVRQFVELLRYTDEREKKTGDPGADFRSEAFTYIAGSLTYFDFAGPGEQEPFIPRSDVLDLERDARIAEQKMRIGIQRIQDDKLLPQDQKWSVEIFKSLASEYKEINQLRNQIEISDIILKNWPCYREAPMIQAGIADTYDELTRQSREGTAEYAENSARALDARSKLANYVVGSSVACQDKDKPCWAQCNKDDPEALMAAERLVRGGLQRAAADHTNFARAFFQKARETGDQSDRAELLARALQEYELAEKGWGGYLDQEPNAPDAYESRFWLAEARHGIVQVKVAMGQSPRANDVLRARQAAVAVRDSNEDDKFLEVSATYAVNLAVLVFNDQLRVYRESGGARGLPERAALKFEGEGENRKVVKEPLEPAARFLNLSQEEYIQRVPANVDVNKRIPMFRFNIAESYFLHGLFDDAKKRYAPIYEEDCGKSDFGYRAWERLITMSNLEGDVVSSRKLAEAQKEKSCATSQEQKTAEALIINPTLQEAAYLDAREAYTKAEGMKDGPERQEMWRKAAALYRAALEAAPDRDEAPEAAMNGANAYKQVSEYDKAIAMYNLFIGKYGDDKTLAKLQEGDPRAKPPAPPNPKKYESRVKFLKQAYEQLSKSYVLFFNYRKAAEEYDKISQVARFEEKDRRVAAKNSLILYANMGDRAKTDAARKRLLALNPTAEERAEADFIVARGEFNEWDDKGRDEGANREARGRGMYAMQRYHDANQKNPAANRFVVIAAYNVARTRRAGGDATFREWYKRTIQAYDRFRGSAPIKDGRSSALGSPQAAMAAECEYALLDEELRKSFDYDTNHHRYQGTTVDVISKYRAGAKDAEKYNAQLEHVIDAYLSPEWVVAARSRQGSLYDSLRTGLYNARPPGLKLFNDKEQKILDKFRNSDDPDDQEKADAYEQKRRELWRTTRDQELASADQIAVNRYTQAVFFARKYNVSNPAVDKAIQRLAFLTDIIGDDKMRQYAQTVKDFTYADGMFLRSRPGITSAPDPKPLPLPLPVVPQ
jgi:TolA-binding protein